MRVIACSSRSYSSESPAWLASVSNSRRSSAVNEEETPTRSPSTITPVSRVSPGTGATSAWRIPRASMVVREQPRGVRRAPRARPPGPRRRPRAARRRAPGSSGSMRTSRPLRSSAVRSGWSPGEEHDLGHLDAERLARAPQQVHQRGLDVRRARERAGDAVEELQALVLGALGQVGAVGEQQDAGGREQQPAGAAVLGDQRRAGEADARVGERHQQVGAHHQRHPARREHALGQRDRREHERRAGHRAHEHGGEHRQPQAGAERLRHRGQRMQRDHRQAGGEPELGEVEDRA